MLRFAAHFLVAVSTLSASHATEDTCVTGRLIDEGGRALADRKVKVQVIIHDSRGSGLTTRQSGYTLETDGEGRFHFAAAKPWEPLTARRLKLDVFDKEAKRPAEAFVNLSQKIPSEGLDLGDLVLFVPESPKRWTLFTDDELEAEWLRWSSFDKRRELEGLLREMGRRGGTRWITYIKNRRADLAEPDELGRAVRGLSLPLTRALRRAEGKPDPLRLRLKIAEPLHCTFPQLPRVEWELVNASDEDPLLLTEGGSYRSGRFGRVRIELEREDGVKLGTREHDAMMLGGMSTDMTLQPGSSRPFTTDFSQYVSLVGPGNYRIRVLYHDSVEIASYDDARAYMVVESNPIDLVVNALVIRLTRADHAAHLADIKDIDTSKPVLLTQTPWAEKATYTRAPTSPEDRLFRAGRNALPALLDALSAPQVDPKRADWIAGMCFNITGVFSPAGLSHCALPKHRWIPVWPAVEREGPGNFRHREAMKSTETARQFYHARWRSLRECVEIDFID